MSPRFRFCLAGLATYFTALNLCAVAQTTTATATFNNIGVVVDLPAPTTQTLVRVFIKAAGAPDGDFREVHSLSRLTSTRFAGSVFGLKPGTGYDLKFTSAAFGADQLISTTTRSDVFPAATGTTYHVSPVSGNDNNTGTSFAQAFKTFGKALTVANAGAKILLYDGNYHEGDLSAPRSGTASAPIVIENAPGAKPVLNGIDTSFSPTWTLYDAANHVYRTPCTSTPQNAYLNGGQFFHYQVLADLLSRRWNQPGGYFVNGSFLYARFPNDTPPGTNVVTIPAFTTGLTLSQRSYLQIRGVEFCFYGRDAFHRAIYIDGGDFNLIDRCVFHHNGVGVAFKRAADFNTVQSCTFSESPISTWSWHAVKDGGGDYETGGVVIYGSNEKNRGNVVRHCTFTDMFDGSHLYSDDGAGPTENFDFHNNVMQGCNDDCVETDGAGSNCRIYFNRFHGFLTGVSVAPAAIGPTYIFRNLLTDWRSSEEFSGYPFKFNVDTDLTIDWIYLYHNTCVTTVPGQHGFWFKQYSNWKNVISRNNIYAGTDYALESEDNVTSNVDLDYDCLFTTKAAPVIRWAGTNYNSLNQFASAVGEETHGIWIQPAFVNPAARDYYLPANSPLIDKAVLIPGINDEFLGSAPDIGALEFGMKAKRISLAPGGGVEIDWHVGAFGNYQMEYTPDLSPSAWQTLGGPVQAEHALLQLIDSSATGPRRFYRLKQMPP
jgi:hypothetical protein